MLVRDSRAEMRTRPCAGKARSSESNSAPPAPHRRLLASWQPAALPPPAPAREMAGGEDWLRPASNTQRALYPCNGPQLRHTWLSVARRVARSALCATTSYPACRTSSTSARLRVPKRKGIRQVRSACQAIQRGTVHHHRFCIPIPSGPGPTCVHHAAAQPSPVQPGTQPRLHLSHHKVDAAAAALLRPIPCRLHNVAHLHIGGRQLRARHCTAKRHQE